jgi:hypothetical protein
MTFDTQVTTEVSDRIAEIGRQTMPAKPANYDTADGLLFRRALALIAHSDNWCTFTLNQTGDYGQRQFCSIGAWNEVGDTRYAIFDALRRATNNDIVTFNNTHTHAEVIAMWHEAGRANGWML